MAASAISRLLARGVVCPDPGTVWVGDEVPAESIAPGVVVHPGCRITGAETSIGPGCELGAEAPVTLDNCQLSHGVRLKGGFFAGSTLWDGVELGSAAHVRPGCLLEESSGGGHAVGLKQTILFPFVTLGSLVNFCDVLMSGGTSRKDHGEVGSSYVHFNFTPHQDKATASLLGDVPRGVMLDQRPIFLGGQGGLIGPRRLAFGTVVAAGAICRHDVLQENTLHVPAAPEPGHRPYEARRYGLVTARIASCVAYLGHLRALQEWYRHARTRLLGADPYRAACVAGAQLRLATIWDERVKRLGELFDKLPDSLALITGDAPSAARVRREQEHAVAAWPKLAAHLQQVAAKGRANPPGEPLHAAPPEASPCLRHEIATAERDRWLACELSSGGDYVSAVRSWPAATRLAGTTWLQAVVDTVCAGWQPAGSRLE